jgi:hypothetical protein
MPRLGILIAFAAAMSLPAAVLPKPAVADGAHHRHHHRHHHHHHHHHHHWGTGHWDVVRWADGDCKIWHDDGVAPWGGGWKLVGYGNETYAEAWAELVELQRDGVCR